MPQTEYHEMLDNPRSYFGVTSVYVHDVSQPPFEELGAQLLVFESPVSGPEDLARRYRELLKTTIHRWSEDRAAEFDVFWLNSFMDLEILSRQVAGSKQLTQWVAEYRDLEEKLATPKRIVGMSEPRDGFDIPLLEGGDATDPQEVVHRGYLAAIEAAACRRTGATRKWPASSGGTHRSSREPVDGACDGESDLALFVWPWHRSIGRQFWESRRPAFSPRIVGLPRTAALIDSGWSVKAVIREIVLSDTFRQSSAATDRTTLKDPENNLFHRYGSRRLEAEVIRDSILSVSGRLDPTMFGPSVNPYRPGDVDRRKLYAGPLDGAGRRSMYLKVTRMGPSKLLELFNFPDPSMTRGRRDRTNVPAQALGLMNHPFVHQQAQVNARRLLKEAGSSMQFATSLEALFLRLLSRPPSEAERKQYAEFFSELAAEHGLGQGTDALQSTAVWKDLIHTLYNLKEFTYVL